MMDFGLKMMKVGLKMMSCRLRVMNVGLKMMHRRRFQSSYIARHTLVSSDASDRLLVVRFCRTRLEISSSSSSSRVVG